MRRRRTPLEIFSLSFLDCICCGLGAVLIILLMYVHALRKMENTVPSLQAHITTLSNDVISLNNRIAVLSSAVGSQTNTILQLSNAWMGLVVECARLSDELRLAQDQARVMGDLGGTVQQQLNLIQSLSNQLRQAQSTRTILGIPIAQKRLVFLIDISGSMEQDQRLADVKGAFKVMLTSLDPQYHINIIAYTSEGPQNAQKLVYRTVWNTLTPVDADTRRQAINFVTQLAPLGGTPTATAVARALREHPTADAMILLSDGEPNDPGMKTVDDCAEAIKRANTRSIPIHTIGVGSEMADPNSPGRSFMERVAKDSHAVCISF